MDVEQTRSPGAPQLNPEWRLNSMEQMYQISCFFQLSPATSVTVKGFVVEPNAA